MLVIVQMTLVQYSQVPLPAASFNLIPNAATAKHDHASQQNTVPLTLQQRRQQHIKYHRALFHWPPPFTGRRPS